MALDIKGIKRVFKLKKGNATLVLEDPDLTTATLHGPEFEEDRAVYHFKTTIGTKG